MVRLAAPSRFTVPPAEVLVVVLLLTGVTLPMPVIVAAELGRRHGDRGRGDDRLAAVPGGTAGRARPPGRRGRRLGTTWSCPPRRAGRWSSRRRAP